MIAPREYKKLHAEWYELASDQQDHQPEIEFWDRCIRESGEPVLELGSGTGRVLIPLLERGFDIAGIDTSTAMTERCSAECSRRKLSPTVYAQSMLEMELGRDYALIILTSGGLGLFTSDDDITRLFERVACHLRPGGRFIYEYEPVPDARPAGFSSDRLTGTDGSTLAWETRRRYDETTHVWTSTFSLEKIIDGEVVERERNERVGRYFTGEEAAGFARAAGLQQIAASDWLARGPITRQSRVVTVQCSKGI